MTGSLLLDGLRVPVETGGSSRRARLTIERDGSLTLRAAADVDRGELQAFLASKREWIYTKLAEKELLKREPVVKELVNGEGFLYLGRSYQLRIEASSDQGARLAGGRLRLPTQSAGHGRDLLIEWYTSRGMAWIAQRLTVSAARLEVHPESLDVADLGHKWGAATAAGRLRIHWATLQLRPGLVDYVIAHELAHLREPHHGPAFWRRLARVMPDYEQRKSELAAIGPSLWFGDVRGTQS